MPAKHPAAKVSGHGKPQPWPDKCGSCGAHWSNIGFDYAYGFNCRKCGASDADDDDANDGA